MFKKLLLLFNGLSIVLICLGQNSTSPVVMASSGGFFSSNGYSLSYTLGELSIKTLTKSSNILTEGFQQGKQHKVVLPFKDIRYFPNPVTSTPLHLDFYTDDGQSFIVQVYSVTGRLMAIFNYDNVVNGERRDISFEGVEKGLYLIKIQSKDGKIQKLFKIERL